MPEMDTFGLEEHTVLSVPAFTTGAGVMVTNNASEVWEHPLVEVNVRVTVPFVMSEALGV